MNIKMFYTFAIVTMLSLLVDSCAAGINCDQGCIVFSASQSKVSNPSEMDLNFGLPEDIFITDASGSRLLNLTKTSELQESLPSWSPDGTRIAFLSVRDGSQNIFTMKTDGSNLVQVTDGGPWQIFDYMWSPDGTRIVFIPAPIETSDSEFEIDLYLVNSDGSDLFQLTDDNSAEREPRWSPAGDQLAYFSDSNLMLHDIKDSKLLTLIDLTGTFREKQPSYPLRNIAWSPDGTRIALDSPASHGQSDKDVLLLINVGDSTISQLFEDEPSGVSDFHPIWSPDGRRIAFSGPFDPLNPNMGGSGLWVIDLETYSVLQLTQDNCSTLTLPYFWSPDGERIFFYSSCDGIQTVNRDGSSKVILKDSHSWCLRASSNTKRITFLADKPFRPPQIFLMDIDGSNFTEVTNDHFFKLSCPVWSP